MTLKLCEHCAHPAPRPGPWQVLGFIVLVLLAFFGFACIGLEVASVLL